MSHTGDSFAENMSSNLVQGLLGPSENHRYADIVPIQCKNELIIINGNNLFKVGYFFFVCFLANEKDPGDQRLSTDYI